MGKWVSFILLMTGLALAQPRPAFEAATIKPSVAANQPMGLFTYSGGRIVGSHIPLAYLISVAYDIDEQYLRDGPTWVYENRYSIEAVPPPDSASAKYSTNNIKLMPPQEELEMLRGLLEERFALKVREEMREGPVLALEVKDGGHKLTPAKDREDFPVVAFGVTGVRERPNFLQGYNASMDRFARRLSEMLGRPVVNRTGIEGTFDFRIDYAQNPATSDGPALTTVVQDLGLRLTASRGEVRHLVIEHAELPGEN